MSDLKPCPFCGGEAELYTGHQNAWTGEYLANVRCGKCGITVPVKVSLDQAEAEAEAIEAWNRRVDDHFRDVTKMVERTAKPKKGAYDLIRCDCGMPVSSNYDFCPRCGSKLDWSDHE